MNKNKTNNGVNKLTDEQEEMRMQVVDLEMKARYWKAQYEIRHYTLQAETIQPDYDKYLEAQAQLRKQAQEEFEKMIAEANKMAEEGKLEVTTEEKEA
jgi:hypothetical protein